MGYIKTSFAFVLFFCFISLSLAENTHNNPSKIVDPFKTGNFILPASQQPGALIGFGQNVIDKNELQLFLMADDFLGIQKHAIDVIPGILYGITDNFSVFFNLPYAANYQEGRKHSAGLEDAFVQLEYAFYNKQGKNFSDQATIVTGLTFPTGAALKDPSTGVGSPSVFLGGTFNRTYPDWFAYTSHGVTLMTTHNNTRYGDIFLYQFGFGRNLFDIGTRWIFAWQAELDGQYAKRNRISGVTDPNSGGNVVYFTPSLMAASNKLIFQFGVGRAISQNLYGNQTKNTYLVATNIGWTLS